MRLFGLHSKKVYLTIGVLSLFSLGIGGGWWWWTRTNGYHLRRLVADAPVAEAANSPEGQEAIKVWVYTLAAAGKFDEAQAATNHLSDARQRVPGLASMAAGLERAGKQADAQKIIQELLALATNIPDPDLRLQSLAEAGKQLWLGDAPSAQNTVFEAALKAASEISDLKLRTKALSSAAASLATAKVEAFPQRFFDAALTSAKEISPLHTRCDQLEEIAGDLASAELSEQARQVFNEAISCAEKIPDREKRVEAYTEIVSQGIFAGQAETVLSAAKKLPLENRILAGMTAAILFASSQHYQSAASVAQGIPIYAFQQPTLASVAETLAERGKLQESLSVARSLKSRSDRTDAFFKIALNLANAASDTEGVKVRHEALTELRALEPSTTRTKAAVLISEADQEPAKLDTALTETENVRGGSDRAELLGAIASKLVRADRQEKLLPAISKLPKDERPEALTKLAIALAAHGQAQRAVEVAKQIEDEDKRLKALKSVTKELGKAGRGEDAIMSARLVPEPAEERWFLWQETAQEALKIGKLMEAVKIARNIPDAGTCTLVTAKLVAELADASHSSRGGDFKEPLLSGRSIEADTSDSLVLAAIAYVYGAQGRLAEARRVSASCTAAHKLLAYAAILGKSVTPSDSNAKKKLDQVTFPWSREDQSATERKNLKMTW